MPKLLQVAGLVFYFTTHDRGEPPHVHVSYRSSRRDRAKVWLKPVELEYSWGFSKRETSLIVRVVEQHRSHFLEEWESFFGQI